MKFHEYALKSGITRTKEFERKKLATHAVNVGTKCGHGCTYCSTGTMLRMHRSFRTLGLNPFENGYAIVDPTVPERVARDAKRIRKRGMVQLCTTVDAWSPEAQKHDLGRRCLEAILAEPGWRVRVLTKNASVVKDFDLIAKHRDRVLIGLSITATPSMEEVVAAIEPHASSISDRMAALSEAHSRGLRTYAMFCPLLPKISCTAGDVDALVSFAVECGVEEVFAEPVNPRGPGLRLTLDALHRHPDAYCGVSPIQNRVEWSRYVVKLLRLLQNSMRTHSDISRLRFLLYPSRLTQEDLEEICRNDAGVIWLGRDKSADVPQNGSSLSRRELPRQSPGDDAWNAPF
jgi:DNA repair photolyase